MPIKRVQFPDGSIHRIEVPEGATDEQIINFVKDQHPAAQNTNANDSDFASMVGGKKPASFYDKMHRNIELLPVVGGAAASLVDAGDAVQHHVLNAVHGPAQLLGHTLESGADAMLGPDSSVAKWLHADNAYDTRRLGKREADYQARVPNNAGTYIGAGVGDVLPWMYGMGELRAAGLLPKITNGGLTGLLLKGGALATEGGAIGATQPVIEDGSYGQQKAAQIGVGALAAPLAAAGMKGATAGLGGLASLSRYATPAGREMVADSRVGRLLGDDPVTLAQLRQDSGIPGYEFTPAQAIGTPEAVQAERVLRNNGNTAPAFAARESANNAALRNHVAGVAGDDAAMQAALQARREGPGAFWKDNLPRGAEEGRYGRAQAHLAGFLQSRNLPMPEYHIIDKARLIAGQIQRGSISQAEGDAALRALAPKTRGGQKALDQALGMIDGGMVNPSRIITRLQTLSKDTNPSISKAADAALAALAKNQDGQGWVHAQVLDGLRQNFGKLLADNSPNGVVGSAEGAVYGPLKAKITNTVERALPGYRNNLAAYASASAPINDMEAGRALLRAIDSNTLDAGGNQNVGIAQVRAMLAKDNRARFPMSDQAREQIERVLAVLQRRSIAHNNIAAAGPGTAADLQRAVQASPLLMRLLGHGAGVAGGFTFGPAGYLAGAGATELATAANNSVARSVGAKAASARTAADAMEAARLRRMPAQPSVLDYLLPYEQPKLPPPR